LFLADRRQTIRQNVKLNMALTESSVNTERHYCWIVWI